MDTVFDYWAKLGALPTFRAAGKTELSKRILDNARWYFNNSSEQFKRTETNYELLLMTVDYSGALDTLEAQLNTTRADDPRAYISLDLGHFWWLKFSVPPDSSMCDNPRLHSILARREELLNVQKKTILELIGET